MASDRDRLVDDLVDEESRREFANEFLDSRIALQIKALRQQRQWTQAQLAKRAGMRQSQISRLENVNNSSWTIATLKRLAAAFDLPLYVLFPSWSQLVDDSLGLSRSSLERPTFAEDESRARGRQSSAGGANQVLEFNPKGYRRQRDAAPAGPPVRIAGVG